MALLRDGHINTLDDLVLHESGLLGVTSVERIDLNAKMLLAQETISGEIVMFLVSRAGLGRRRLGISDVVITGPLKRWHALRTIELAYEDAYNNQLNDRYRGKWQQYRQRAESAADHLFSLGIGLVPDPIGRANSPLLLAVAGAVMQFPAERSSGFSNQIVRFLDGSEQRFRDMAQPLHRWAIRLNLLDESELNRLREFFRLQNGAAASFGFTDPWDGTQYADCSLESDEMTETLTGEGRATTSLVIRENKT